MCFQSLLLMTIFFQYEELSEPIGKDRKMSQYSEGTDPPSCFGTCSSRSRDCSFYTSLEDGVLRRTPAQVF